MGSKYSTQTISSYNATPPADDGTVSEANKVKWSTVKTKLTDPHNTTIAAINTALVTHFNVGPTALSSNTTLGATHYNQVIEASGSSVTLTLTDASSLGAGWFTEIRVVGTANITLTGATTADTCNGVAFSTQTYTLRPGFAAKIMVNAAADGFLVLYEGLNRGNDGALMSQGVNSASIVPWVPSGWIAGIVLSLDTDTDHDVNITAGECADSGDAYMMKITSEFTKQIDNTFAAGDDAGGMFTGSVAATTVYYIHLIRKDSDGSIDAGFDTSSSAANIPSGYTAYRMIGICKTDGSSNIDTLFWYQSANMLVGNYTTASLAQNASSNFTMAHGFSSDNIVLDASAAGDNGTADTTAEFEIYMFTGDHHNGAGTSKKIVSPEYTTLTDPGSFTTASAGNFKIVFYNRDANTQAFLISISIHHIG